MSALTSLREKFSSKISFHKKSRERGIAPVPIMQISAPLSTHFDHEKHPVPPWVNDYCTHNSYASPVPPPKTYHTKYASQTTPSFDHDWQRSRSTVPIPTSVAPPPWELATKSIPIVTVSGGIKNRIFKNAGTDERGRLKLDYQDIEEADWGEPDEYTHRLDHEIHQAEKYAHRAALKPSRWNVWEH